MSHHVTASDGTLKDPPSHRRLAESLASLRDALWRNPAMLFGLGVLAIMAIGAFGAPLFGLPDPKAQNPIQRLRPPSAEQWFGTDMYGRDLFSRVLYGGQISLVVGLSVGLLATSIGLAIG